MPRAQMWEYVVERVEDENPPDSILKLRGYQGWELVAVTEFGWKDNDNNFHATTALYFKRALIPL